MSPDFSHQYDCSLSTSFSSKLRGSCPCILFPHHLSFVFPAILSFICIVLLCTSVIRHLAVCNTAELMLCWCVLTVCISVPSFVSRYSTVLLFLLVRPLLSASGPFLSVFWEHISDLHLPLGDVVHGWLAVSSLSCLVFVVLLGAS